MIDSSQGSIQDEIEKLSRENDKLRGENRSLNELIRTKKLEEPFAGADNHHGPWCAKKIEPCGGSCCLSPDHGPPCMCWGDRKDKPGSCPGKRSA
jgi:hypothetical protein